MARSRSSQSHYQVSEELCSLLQNKELTVTDRRLFWYLFSLDRWGDRFVTLPTQAQIALDLGVSRQTVNQSQAKLQQLGLWDFRISGWEGRNLSGASSTKFQEDRPKQRKTKTPDTLSGKPDTLSGKPDTLSGKPDTLSGKPDNPVSETLSQQVFQNPSDLIQTNTDLLHTLSDPECACEGKQNSNLDENQEPDSVESFPLPVQTKNPSSQPEPTEPQPDSNFPPRENDSQKRSWGTIATQRTPIKPDTQRFEQQFEPLPPWLIGRQWYEIDPKFAQWLQTYLPRHSNHYQQTPPDLTAVKAWAVKARVDTGRYDQVAIAFEAFQQDQQKTTQRQEYRDIGEIAAADCRRELEEWYQQNQAKKLEVA